MPLALRVLLLTLPFLAGCSRSNTLVVYCAHDSVYADAVLRDFSQRTGIRVTPRYDTEATKSLGLVELIIRERDHPRCDLFWNNEPLGTMDLHARGLLQPHQGTGFQRIPPAFRDPEGHWVGFAARLRVFIVNTDKMPATEAAVNERLQSDLTRVAIAKPLYGTTLTHYSVLWNLWGEEKTKAWHRQTRERGIKETGGNAMVKNLVAEGACELGFTDTDDFFVALDDAKPVAMLPIKIKTEKITAKGRPTETESVILIPNTVAIIKGTRKEADAQKLADFLLSAEAELALAKSKSRQIPLGPVEETSLPSDVRELKKLVLTAYPLGSLTPARDATLRWLKEEYLKN